MDAKGYDPDSPTLSVGVMAEGGGSGDDHVAADMPLDEVVEAVFSGASTAPGILPGASAGTVPDGSDETTDHPARGGTDDRETVRSDPQETTAPSAGRTVASAHPEGPMPMAKFRRDIVPGYTIHVKMGRGGMGDVYKAQQNHMKKLVALKMIRADRCDNPSEVKRFMAEAEAVARLDHPNIVKIFHFGECEWGPYFVLELLEGGTLTKRLDGLPQPPRAAAGLTATLARAVDVAHSKGILHRDLKPSNILFDADDVPKITDFGLAKRLEAEDSETRYGQVIGTPAYMSPEQARGWGREIGRGTDIYSLGVILFEMLTGSPPLKGADHEETVKLVIHKEPVPPSKIRPDVPRDLETICLKCLEKEPERRFYATALALAEDLERFLAGRPILARRTPLWERGVKLARRRPWAASLAVIGIAGAVAAGATALDARERERVRVAEENERALIRIAKEGDRIRGEMSNAERILVAAGEDLGAGRGGDVLEKLVPLRARLEKEPHLAGAMAKADELLLRARAGMAAKEAGERAEEDYDRFVEARDAAFFLDLDGRRDEKGSAQAVADAARAGLSIFGRPPPPRGEAWDPPAIPGSLSERQRGEVAVGSYELLAILADAVSLLPGAEPSRRADEALAILDRADALHPGGTRAGHLRRAAYLTMKGDRDGAAREREAAGRARAPDPFDFFLVGRDLFREREWESAIGYLEDAVRERRAHFWARCLLAICHIQNKEHSKALPYLTGCLDDKPDSIQLHLLRGIAGAAHARNARDLAREQARGNPGRASSLAALSEKHFKEAEEDYRDAFELLEKEGSAAGNADLRYALLQNRGMIRLETGDLDAAEADFRAAIELDGGRFEAYSSLAEVDRRRGRADRAVENLTRAIELNEDYAPLYQARAGVLIGLKELPPDRREAAIRDLEAAIRLEAPGSDAVAIDQANLAALLLRDESRREEAIAACDAALKIEPGYTPAHLIRLKALLALGRHDDLIRLCDAALASAPTTGAASAQVHELRGMARDLIRRSPEAIEDYTVALRIARSLKLPGAEPGLLIRRGWSHLAARADRLALQDFEKAIEHDPEDADAHAGRGMARARLGQHREAVDDAEAAVRLDGAGCRTACNAARVYAQAALAVGGGGPAAAPRIQNKYQDRSAELLRRGLALAPADRRSADRGEILKDPLLKTLGNRLRGLDPIK